MSEHKDTLGKRIRKYRKAAGMTMKELALKLDLSEQAISQYERDKREPNILILKDISRVLKINITDLLILDTDPLFGDSLIKERTGIIANLNIREIENLENLLNTRNPLLLNFELLSTFKGYRELIPDNITIEDYSTMATLISENILSVLKIFISKYNQPTRLNKLEKYTNEYNDFITWLKEDYKDIDMSTEAYFSKSNKKDIHLIHNYYDIIQGVKSNFLNKKATESIDSENK